MRVEPYLFFEGRCDEAIEFYREAVGAQVLMLMRYGDSPQPTTHGRADKVMHAMVRIGESTICVSDGMCTGQAAFGGFSLSLMVATPQEADRAFGALAAGGQVQMPLGETFFSPRFGMLSDQFGVRWIIYSEPAGQDPK